MTAGKGKLANSRCALELVVPGSVASPQTIYTLTTEMDLASCYTDFMYMHVNKNQRKRVSSKVGSDTGNV